MNKNFMLADQLDNQNACTCAETSWLVEKNDYIYCAIWHVFTSGSTF